MQMKYSYRFKEKQKKEAVSDVLLKYLSDLFIFLFQSRIAKLIHLNHTEVGKFVESIYRRHKRLGNVIENSEFPGLEINSITYIDYIENEDLPVLRKNLEKVIDKYKRSILWIDPAQSMKNFFEKFEELYKSVSWGNIYDNDVRGVDGLDLIDRISYKYIKGKNSHIVLSYSITPSEKFKNLFKSSLIAEPPSTSRIYFYSFLKMITKKKIFRSFEIKYEDESFWIDKAFNELNYQLKTEVAKKIGAGIFTRTKHQLFPSIVAFSYSQPEFNLYKKNIFRRMNINQFDCYSGSNIFLSMKSGKDMRHEYCRMEIFIEKSTNNGKERLSDSVDFLLSEYIYGITPFWLLISISDFQKSDIVKLRKKTDSYIRKNTVSLFLNELIKIKNDVSINWITFGQIKEELINKFFKSHIIDQKIPAAYNGLLSNEISRREFKKELVDYAEFISNDIKKSYDDLLFLFTKISEDNNTRANMRLQRVLLLISIVGIFLAIYNANNDWCNQWILYLLNSLNIQIPQAPKINVG